MLFNILLSGMKKQVTGKDSGGDTGEVRQQCAGESMAHLFNADTAKINGKHIKCGLGTALHDG